MIFDNSIQKKDLGKIAVKEKSNAFKSFTMKNPDISKVKRKNTTDIAI